MIIFNQILLKRCMRKKKWNQNLNQNFSSFRPIFDFELSGKRSQAEPSCFGIVIWVSAINNHEFIVFVSVVRTLCAKWAGLLYGIKRKMVFELYPPLFCHSIFLEFEYCTVEYQHALGYNVVCKTKAILSQWRSEKLALY